MWLSATIDSIVCVGWGHAGLQVSSHLCKQKAYMFVCMHAFQ
jgi:hypothetical protein